MAEIHIVCLCVCVGACMHAVVGLLFPEVSLTWLYPPTDHRIRSHQVAFRALNLLSSVLKPNKERWYGWRGSNCLNTEWWKQMSTIQNLDTLILSWRIVVGVWSHSHEQQIHIRRHRREKLCSLGQRDTLLQLCYHSHHFRRLLCQNKWQSIALRQDIFGLTFSISVANITLLTMADYMAWCCVLIQ